MNPEPAFLSTVKCCLPLRPHECSLPSPHVHVHAIITQRHSILFPTEADVASPCHIHILLQVWSGFSCAALTESSTCLVVHRQLCILSCTQACMYTHVCLGPLVILPGPALAPGIELISNSSFSGPNAQGQGVVKGIYFHFLPSCWPSRPASSF